MNYKKKYTERDRKCLDFKEVEKEEINVWF